MLQANMDEYLPLRDVVFNTLRQGILTGELKPGERLMEIHLANRLGVSRTPIREAVRKLEIEGLVVTIPRKGAHVASITEKHLQDVLEVRRAMEALTVAVACERINMAELKQLREACDRFEESTKTLDARTIASADVELHDIILRTTKNERLITMVNNLAEQMYRYRFAYIRDTKSYKGIVKEHDVLYQCMLEQNVDGAVEAIKIHIDNQAISIFKLLD